MKLPAGIESRLKQARDWLVEEEKSPSTGTVPMTAAEERRRAIALLASGVLLGGIFSTSAKTEGDILQGKGNMENMEVHERVQEFDEDELTENRIEMFKVVFANLTRDQIVFVDQNWNMIGGGPIEVSDEIKALSQQVASNGGAKREELLAKRRELFQTWLNDMRRKLKKQYPTIEFDISPDREDFEKPEQFSVYASLMDEPEGTTKLDVVLKNAKKHAVLDENFCEYRDCSDRSYTRFDLIRSLLHARVVTDTPSLGLPELLQELLAALPAVESMYDPALINSETGASGAWQIIEELGKERGLVREGYDGRRYFATATDKMADYFAELYKTIKNNPDVKQLQDIYGLNEEHIVHPLVLSSYHSGFGRNIERRVGQDGKMRDGMVRWFLANVSPKMVRQHIGNPPYGRDLFTLMTTLYMNQSGDRRYFKKSRDYYVEVAAFRDLLFAENPGKVEVSGEYAPPSDMISERMPKRKKLSARAEHIALFVGGTALVALADVFRRKEITRRGLFGSLGAATATSLLGTAYGSSLVERQITRPLESPIPFVKPQISDRSRSL